MAIKTNRRMCTALIIKLLVITFLIQTCQYCRWVFCKLPHLALRLHVSPHLYLVSDPAPFEVNTRTPTDFSQSQIRPSDLKKFPFLCMKEKIFINVKCSAWNPLHLICLQCLFVHDDSFCLISPAAPMLTQCWTVQRKEKLLYNFVISMRINSIHCTCNWRH